MINLHSRFKPTTLVVIGTDCIGSCKSNYNTITTIYICVILHREVLFIFLQRINIGFSTIVFTGSVTSECKMYSEFILMSVLYE
jgi:hypothetical protein